MPPLIAANCESQASRGRPRPRVLLARPCEFRLIWPRLLPCASHTAAIRVRRGDPRPTPAQRAQPTATSTILAHIPLDQLSNDRAKAQCRQLQDKTGAQLQSLFITVKVARRGRIQDFTAKLFVRWGAAANNQKDNGGLMRIWAMADRTSCWPSVYRA